MDIEQTISHVVGRQLTREETDRLRQLERPSSFASFPGYQAASGHQRHAQHAPRWADGTFMSYEDERHIADKARERYAKAGRARAICAKRAADGSFLPG